VNGTNPLLTLSNEQFKTKSQHPTLTGVSSSMQTSLDARESYVAQATLEFLERSYSHMSECVQHSNLLNRGTLGEEPCVEPDTPFQYTPESLGSSGILTESRGDSELDMHWTFADWSMARLSDEENTQP
jgi:hypothetical protein